MLDTSRLPIDIDAIAFDFDGVFTDNTVYVNEDGGELVRCSREDGMGIDLLRNHGFPMIVISKECNKVVTARCNKLRIPVNQAVDDKLPLLRSWLTINGLSPDNTIYVGNDINDIQCLEYVGCGVAPSDCHPDILPFINIQLTKRGGCGCIRELADAVLSIHQASPNRRAPQA